MNIRYQADADLNQAIVTGVLRREPTIDFQTKVTNLVTKVPQKPIVTVEGAESGIDATDIYKLILETMSLIVRN